MTDLTLEDLVSESQPGPVDGSVIEPEPGNSTMDIVIERLEETGKLDQLIDAVLFGKDPSSQERPTSPPTDLPTNAEPGPELEPEPNEPMTQDNSINSEKLTQMLKTLYDYKGDMSLREMIVLCENNPEMVDNLIRQYL